MNWNSSEQKWIATCACGKGKVTRIETLDENDDLEVNDSIECSECANKYHLESFLLPEYQNESHEDTFIEKTYLVENGYSLLQKTEEKKLRFHHVEDEVVALYSKDELLQVIDEMKAAKYSTKLELSSSQCIVALYSKRYKRKSLNPIIQLLTDCINEYDTFKWNPVTVEKYYENEKLLIKEGQFRYKEALNHAKEIEWEQ